MMFDAALCRLVLLPVLLVFAHLWCCESTWELHTILPTENATFSCSNSSPIVGIKSSFVNSFADRHWSFYCGTDSHASTDFFSLSESRLWDNYQSILRAFYQLECNIGYYWAGLYSRFYPEYGDRTWLMICNRLPTGFTTKASRCAWTEEVNRPQQDFNFTMDTSKSSPAAPTADGWRRKVIAGVGSRMYMSLNDRVWRYLLCDVVKEGECDIPRLPHGAVEVSVLNSTTCVLHFSCEDNGFYRHGPASALISVDSCRISSPLPECRRV